MKIFDLINQDKILTGAGHESSLSSSLICWGVFHILLGKYASKFEFWFIFLLNESPDGASSFPTDSSIVSRLLCSFLLPSFFDTFADLEEK